MSNRSGTAYSAPSDANRNKVMLGVSASDGITPKPVEIDPISGGVLVETVSGTSSLPTSGANGQFTVPTGTSTALPSNSLTQGVIIQALSTNTVSIFIGFSGTTVANGFELQPGQPTSAAVNNTNLIYAISGSASQGLCFVGS